MLTIAASIDVWLFRGGAVAWGVFLIAVIAWALLSARRSGTRRCPRCRYDMSATDSRTCPECGRTARSERAMMKRRPRWWAVRLALLASLVIPVGWWAPEAKKHGVIEALPDWALFAAAPLAIVPTNLTSSGRLAPQPSSPGWQGELYEQIKERTRTRLSRLDSSILAVAAKLDGRDELVRLAMLGRPWPEVTAWMLDGRVPPLVRMRDRWVAHLPLRAKVDWYAEGGNTRRMLTATPRSFGGAQEVSMLSPRLVAISFNRMWRDGSSELGIAPPGATSVVFDFELHSEVEQGVTEVIWRGTQTYPITLTSSIEDAIEPVRDPEVTNLLRETMRVGHAPLGNHWARPSAVQLYVALPTVPAPLELKRSGRLTHPLLRGVTLGLRFEYVHDGEVVGRGVAWAADDLERFQYSHVVIQPVGDRRDARGRHALALVTEQPERFTLRVTGDGEMALRHIQGTRYWAGAFERPLAEVLIAPGEPND